MHRVKARIAVNNALFVENKPGIRHSLRFKRFKMLNKARMRGITPCNQPTSTRLQRKNI